MSITSVPLTPLAKVLVTPVVVVRVISVLFVKSLREVIFTASCPFPDFQI